MVFAFAILSVNSPLTFAASPLFTVDTPGLRVNESGISDGNMVVGMPLSVPLISQIKKNGAKPQCVKNGPEKTLLIIPPVGVLPSMMESPLSDSGLPSNVVTAESRRDTDTVGEPVSVEPPCTPKGRSYSLISPSLIQGTLLEPMTVVDTQNTVHNRPKSRITHGPFVGHVDEMSARIWARVDRSGCYRLIVSSKEGSFTRIVEQTSGQENDGCLTWTIQGLQSDTHYDYQIKLDNQTEEMEGEGAFRTAKSRLLRDTLTVAFGSCSNDLRFSSQKVWKQIGLQRPSLMVLLGDTPYIDSTDLLVQRQRYQDFYRLKGLQALFRTIPFYATWDDHDFGANDTTGNLVGKESARESFIAYHANPSYGSKNQGIFTSFRRGPIEVFLIDTRWFAGTEPSPVDSGRPTLLGHVQWDWLKEGLMASQAPFKILASGMIWNGAVRPGKKDHWETYSYERDALFSFFGEQRISGVVLMGGDIHRSRVLRYPTKNTVGYDLTEFISSPLANTVIETADVASPYLLHDVGQQETFMVLTADTLKEGKESLLMRCMNAQGEELFRTQLLLSELGASSLSGPRE
jgi:alkaline phosphatase D